MPLQSKQQPPYYTIRDNSATITLTNDQIKALRTTGILIIPAQGENTYIKTINAVLKLDTTAGAYTNVTEAALVLQSATNQYLTNIINLETSLAAARISVAQFTTQFLEDGTSSLTGFPITYGYATTGYLNSPVYIKDFLGGTDYTGGHANNTLKLYITYQIATLN